MITNLIFDFGGVIAPISREKAVEAFERLGLADADQRLDKYHQTGIFQELEEGKISPDEFQQKLGELCGHTPDWNKTRQAWMGYFTGLDERLLDCLKELRKRYKLFVLSNTNPYVMDWACSPEFSSKGKPLTEYFDKLYLSYQIGVTKPDRRIFDFLIADAGIDPAESLFVDDGPGNVQAARALGFQTYCPRNGEDWRDALAALLQKSINIR
ncbi:HAD family phosphatase [uncultured Bacteroides sp.]|uniref:HAD family hydrolase n=1 Tax=uncultured Bacteroides sp. TaxID=162156 RepID=UPI00280AC6A6|nr:HAD family phosphatase [uncultured Bacteroides sp.]